jgi:hypothetical protein
MNTELSVDDYIEALEKVKNSPKDRVGILGDLSATSLGGIAGAGVAGTAASIAGATTLLGSSTLGTILGGVFITTTPIGWITGLSILGGAAGYGISRLIRSGQKNDEIISLRKSELTKRIKSLQITASLERKNDEKLKHLITIVQLLVKNDKISQQDSTALIDGVAKGSIDIKLAFQLSNNLLKE